MDPDIIIGGIILSVFVIGLNYVIYKYIRSYKPSSSKIETVLIHSYIISITVFLFSLNTHSSEHNFAIDYFLDPCYTPLSHNHLMTFSIFYVLFLVSVTSVWTNSIFIPPLKLCFHCINLIIGLVLNVMIAIQVSTHDTSRIPEGGNHGEFIAIQIMPVLGIIISIYFLIQIIIAHSRNNSNKFYKNTLLNRLNTRLKSTQEFPFWVILLTFPYFLVITLILILFGQDIDSFYKVFTETATWELSQQMHPPTVSDRHGHYLCTVAAYGDPEHVKPLYLGSRHNRIIIVNRQLQIANAFEDLVRDISPKIHKILRECYDKYGFNISKRITTKRRSNFIYKLMKPFEFFFLLCLYLYYLEPEKMIKKQYVDKRNITQADNVTTLRRDYI